MKRSTERTTKQLIADIAKLEAAYRTINAENSAPAEMIAAMELILAGFKVGKRWLTVQLRGRIRNVVKLTSKGKATAEDREMVDLVRTNVIDLAAQIAGLEAYLYLCREWSKVKPV